MPNWVHPDDTDGVREMFCRAFDPTNDGKVRGEHRIVRPDGEVRWILIPGQMRFAGEGAERRAVRFNGILLDITERLPERTLSESEREFSALFHASPVAKTLVTRPEGALYDVNEGWLQLTGFARKEQVVGKEPVELGPFRDAQARARILDELRRQGSLHHAEVTAHNRAGEARTLLMDLLPLRLGGRQLLLSTCLDIADRKRAEEALHRFDLLARHSRDIILFMRRDDGWLLDANAAAIEAHGYSREELLALTIYDLRVVGSEISVADQINLADAQGILFETVHRRKDGRTFSVEVSSQGASIGGTPTLISVICDIRERKATEEARRAGEQSAARFPIYRCSEAGFGPSAPDAGGDLVLREP